MKYSRSMKCVMRIIDALSLQELDQIKKGVLLPDLGYRLKLTRSLSTDAASQADLYSVATSIANLPKSTILYCHQLTTKTQFSISVGLNHPYSRRILLIRKDFVSFFQRIAPTWILPRTLQSSKFRSVIIYPPYLRNLYFLPHPLKFIK